MSSASQFGPVWELLDRQQESGRFPGYAAAIRHQGHEEVRVGGTLAVGGSDPVRPDTVFRIASLSKMVGVVLAFTLIQDGVIALDDPVGRWLAELARPEVLAEPGAKLDETVPALRRILVRDLLASTWGLGLILEPGPLSTAMQEQQLAPGPTTPPMTGAEYMARIGALPLAYQPGERWCYHSGIDVLSVLMTRATGQSAGSLLADRLCTPLGMSSTGFFAHDLFRLASSYRPGPDGLEAVDRPDTYFARPPLFETFGSGLVSTVEDFLAFLQVFSANANADVLHPESVRLISSDAMTSRQRADVQALTGPGTSWGLGVGVDIERVHPWMQPGRFGWNGGSGTTAFVDPVNGLSAVLLTQRMMSEATGDFDEFWSAVYSSL